jgi:hypothetical protein
MEFCAFCHSRITDMQFNASDEQTIGEERPFTCQANDIFFVA